MFIERHCTLRRRDSPSCAPQDRSKGKASTVHRKLNEVGTMNLTRALLKQLRVAEPRDRVVYLSRAQTHGVADRGQRVLACFCQVKRHQQVLTLQHSGRVSRVMNCEIHIS